MSEHEVVVVGAGPVGLAGALALSARGRSVAVVEAGDALRPRPGSRAIFIHKVSLEILERVRPGLGRDLNRHGLAWQTKRTLFRGTEVYRRSYPPVPSGALPSATSLPQEVTERILLQACVDAGVTFVWNTPIAQAAADTDRVRLESEDRSVLSARYVIAADGARSSVRDSAGLRLEGPRTTSAFIIVDAAEDAENPLPIERVFHYQHPDVGGRNVLFVPFAGHWRVDLQCHPDDDPDAFSGADGVRRWLSSVMPARYADRITWVSSYVFRQAIANQFVDPSGRILLAGEAAHVFAPFGARGLNSGIADVFVAAEAIDCALRSGSVGAGSAAIAEFADSRRAAAERNRAASSVALRHLTAASAVRRAILLVAGRLAPSFQAVGRWMDKAPYGPQLTVPDRHGMYY